MKNEESPELVDRKLVDAFLRTRSERSFRQLHRRHTPRLLQFAYLMLERDESRAEDAVQETWARALRGLERFRWESALGTWLSGIAVNVCREAGREHEKGRWGPRLHALRPPDPAITNGGPVVRIELERAVAVLPEGCRTVFLLHDLEGYTHRLWAKIAADPATGPEHEEMARSRLGKAFDDDRWSALIREGREHMRVDVLRGATRLPIVEDVRLEDPSGRTIDLADLLGPQATVVAFWSRFCGPSLEILPEVAGLAAELERQGIPLVAITAETPSPELQRYLEAAELSLPAFHDVRREATRAFGQWATPEFYVLDGDGTVRFALSRLSEIGRQLTVLLEPDL